MNAEALIGTVLGTCMLQKLIGQGGMGAVFLAQQSRPRRQVAVKVLLPVSSQSPNQQAAFLERFRRETDAAASLEHPNIVPVHEYGERDGLAYLVMPYISGGTLRDEMEREEQFLLSKAMSYLDQMAAALNFAHEHGVIHRDIKPANILMTPERRLLLTDFGLVKIVADSRGTPNSRLTAVGVPMGTPDYMAPEQVIGVEVDSRADLYSLGVILFQMVTGKTPFQGDMPMQIAMQHLHTPVPSPRKYRPDLPIPTEQVVLRSLEKRPTDRYANATEFANAFRLSLTVAGVPLGDTQMGMSTPGMVQDARSFTRRSLFDPMWQANGSGHADSPVPRSGLLRPMSPVQANPAPMPPPAEQGRRNDIVAKTSMTMPSFSGFFEPPTRSVPQENAPLADVRPTHMTPVPESVFPQKAMSPLQESYPTKSPQNNPASSHGLRFGRRSLLRAMDAADPSSSSPATVQNPVAEPAESFIPPSMLAAMGLQADSSIAQAQQQQAEAPQPSHPKTLAGLPSSYSETPWQAALSTSSPELNNPAPAESQVAQPLAQNSPEEPGSALTTRVLGNTSALVPSAYEGQGMTGMVKLTQPMKLVKVPIAGKPGTYMTGLLPMSPEIQEAVASQQMPDALTFLRKNLKKVALLALVVLVLISTGAIVAITHKSPTAPRLNTSSSVNLSAAATANAIATVQSANIILEDSLSSNIHSWKESSTGDLSYVFKDGKYHVSVNDGDGAALADLPEEIMPNSFVFSVDASEIKGDDTSVNNQFGLVFRLNQSQKAGQPWVTFYCFQVQNTQNDVEYQLRKYDSSYTDDAEKWSTPWHVNAGKEFHFGHGAAGNNSYKLVVKGGNFTFIVNGKTVGTFNDTSFKAGRVGFLVNQKGTEVAFSNLLLTNN
jgi:eukaryotic-like serine/threonine-protein kinase